MVQLLPQLAVIAVRTDRLQPKRSKCRKGLWIQPLPHSGEQGLEILLSTGYADLPSDARSSLPRLAKPFDQAALAKAIEAAMGEDEPAGSVVAFRPKSA